MLRDVYSGSVQFYGEEHRESLREANNYANALHNLRRFKEVKALLRKMLPAAQRVLTDSHEITLKMRWTYASALHDDPSATLDDFREAVTTLEETTQAARRVLGGAHPLTTEIGQDLQKSRTVLHAREASSKTTN